MGTPIAVTTPNNAETGVIPPVSSPVAASFNELLASVVPPAIATSPEAMANAIGENPTGSIADQTAASAVSTLPVMPFPAVQPLAATMVNAADPAEADLAALMAASQMAMRGVAARLPARDAQTQPDAILSVIAPEDFIGPVRPQGLTAEPAASALVSAELPEAAVAASFIQMQDENFIGPLLPKAQSARIDAQIPLSTVTEDAAGFIALTPAHVVDAAGIVNAIALRDETALPQQQESLLDIQAQVQTINQSADEMALNASLNHDVLNNQEPHLIAAPFMDLPDQARNQTGEPSLTEKTGSTTDTHLTAIKAMDAKNVAVTSDMDAAGISYLPEAIAIDAVTALRHREHDKANNADHVMPLTMASETMPPLSADAFAAHVVQFQSQVQRQVQSQTMREQDLHDQARLRATSEPRPQTQTTIQPKLTPDEALLRVMQQIVPAQKQEQPKNARAVRDQVEASLLPPAHLSVSSSATDRAPLDPVAPQTVLRTPDQALRQALALASQAQPLKDDAKSPELQQSESPPIDAKIAASIRDITIVQANIEAEHDQSLAPTSAAPPPSAIISDHGTRNAPELAAVNADGRRDAKRDAEIRQRQMEQQIHVALRAGIPEIRMQLYPPGLGQVMIRLALDGQKLRLSIKADQQEASDALMQTEAGLRDALTRDGYTLAGFDVHDQSGKNHQHRDNAGPSITQPHTADEKESFSVDMTV